MLTTIQLEGVYICSDIEYEDLIGLWSTILYVWSVHVSYVFSIHALRLIYHHDFMCIVDTCYVFNNCIMIYIYTYYGWNNLIPSPDSYLLYTLFLITWTPSQARSMCMVYSTYSLLTLLCLNVLCAGRHTIVTRMSTGIYTPYTCTIVETSLYYSTHHMYTRWANLLVLVKPSFIN